MNESKLRLVVLEAERFLRLVKELEDRTKLDVANGDEYSWPVVGLKESGALRRSSMDLTRALANLRKSL